MIVDYCLLLVFCYWFYADLLTLTLADSYWFVVVSYFTTASSFISFAVSFFRAAENFISVAGTLISVADVPVTALTHLCVPIDINWQLDGVIVFTISVSNNGPDEATSLKITDILGKEIKNQFFNPIFYIYENGKVEKKIIIE